LIVRPSPLAIDQRLRERVTEAVIAQAGFGHEALNAFLRSRLAGDDINNGALFSELAIEGAAGYCSSGRTPASLEGELLHRDLVRALTWDASPRDFRFDYPAYVHQLEAWKLLTGEDRKSVLVSSGTGSGKTECFLVPLLDDLAREVDASGRLTGVRAVMLYPLNALIASQEERLRHWTRPFGGRIRFALYNGLLREKRQVDVAEAEKAAPEQVVDRQTLRADPPPILLTNNTMLEYMTIRRQDKRILEKSLGKLRWIIIDEAHSYIGSAAAEVSLLLRRVLQAFEVEAKAVRFVATSATLGGSDDTGRDQLRTYLADLAGVSRDQVQVVVGERETVRLPTPSLGGPLDLGNRDDLLLHPAVQRLVREAELGAVPLSRIGRHADACGVAVKAVVEAVADHGGETPVLPIRVHKFLRAVPGLWSCLNPACEGPKPDGWPFGGLLFQRGEACPHCNASAFEMLCCRECGEPWLNAFDNGDRIDPARTPPDEDEFAAAGGEDDSAAGDDEEEGGVAGTAAPGARRLIATRPLSGLGQRVVDPTTGAVPDRRGAGLELWMSNIVEDGSCPRCHASQSAKVASPLRPFRFGAPFLIQNASPTMLEGVAPAPHGEGALPSAGRQLLSFTDSRQGTARFAANIETMSERSYVRGFIYHLAQKAVAQAEPARRQELEAAIAELRPIAAANPILSGHLRSMEEELAGGAKPVTWKKAVQALAGDVMANRWIREVWRDRDDRFRRDPDAFAEFLLLRELDRRPRRANAVETLGLAKLVFPQIEKLTEASTPRPLRENGFDARAWKDFLYFLIDSPIRANFVLRIAHADARWLLPRSAFLRQIVGPGRDKQNRSDLSWPAARPIGTKSGAVRLLELALDLDSAGGEDRSVINDVLNTAWDQVSPVLAGAGSTFALDFNYAEIAPVAEAWLCPVTHRVLPRLALGRTPYGIRGAPPDGPQSPTSLAFPRLPLIFPSDDTDRDLIVDFLQRNPMVAELRRQGQWNNLSERAAILAPYFRVEEHSAQQPPHRLRSFEKEFKLGAINMLACSTTMEMGVDIGTVEAVLNTNVPPSIANYRQRVGRAGRRGQSFASSLTYARDTPLDREAFGDPVGYLARALRPPQVKLDSERIVQRHVNALLLSRWFREANAQLAKTKCGDFFGYTPEATQVPVSGAPAEQFGLWLEAPTTEAAVAANIKALVVGTALEGRPGHLAAARSAFAEAAEAFGRAWRALDEQARTLEDTARRSLEMQIRRLSGEPLLKELANRSVLPGHGFPNSVVPFINDCREVRARDHARGEEESEASPNRRYDYPSRNADIAIREYAPGAQVVIDGLVWTSAGVTLNWRRPASDDEAREIQSIRQHWKCGDCGETGVKLLRPTVCVNCGSDRLDTGRFLEPAGFRVDWLAEPHSDTDHVAYVEPEAPRISAGEADWTPLLDPALGRIRATSDGRVFNHSRGANKKGYRICLECGRTAEFGEPDLDDHLPLMPRRGHTGLCPGVGRPFTITEPMALGHEIITDVVELQPVALSDPGAAWALASAVREALARRLGIETREVGLAVDRRAGPLGRVTHSIYLLDQAAGGAGYTPQVLGALREILAAARRQLECPAQCERGCSACILSADLYGQQEIVDRKSALAFLDGLLGDLATPRAEDMAAADAQLSPPIADALVRRLRPGDRVTIFALDDVEITALGEPPFSSLFESAHATGAEVRLALSAEIFNALDDAARRGLRNTSLSGRFCVDFGNTVTGSNGAVMLAAVTQGSDTKGFFTRDSSARLMGPRWGVGVEHPVVLAATSAPETFTVPDDELERKVATGDRIKVISDRTGWSAIHFGRNFTGQYLKPELEAVGLWRPGRLVGVEYADRYLNAPLPVLLATRTLTVLCQALAAGSSAVEVSILTGKLRESTYARSPSRLGHDWRDEDDRAGTVAALMKLLGHAASFRVGAPAHNRKLSLHFDDGQAAVVFLDQGFGYWRATGKDWHDFQASPVQQAKSLLDSGVFVEGAGESFIAIARN
jgi:ATP-dependent helicase YprA (DUF1998 family)